MLIQTSNQPITWQKLSTHLLKSVASFRIGEKGDFEWLWMCHTGWSQYFRRCWSTGILYVKLSCRLQRSEEDGQTSSSKYESNTCYRTISEHATWQTLKQMEYSSRRAHWLPLLSAKDRKLKLQLTQVHQNWTIEDGKTIAWVSISAVAFR